MLLQEYLNGIQKELEQTPYSHILVMEAFRMPYLSYRHKFGEYKKKYSYKLGINVMTGRYAVKHVLTIGINLDKTKTFIKEIGVAENPYELSTYEEFVVLCEDKRNEFKNRYESAAKRYFELAASYGLSKEQAIELGDTFYRLSPDSKDIVLDKEDAYVKEFK